MSAWNWSGSAFGHAAVPATLTASPTAISSCTGWAALAFGAWYSGRSQRTSPRFSSSARSWFSATSRSRISSAGRSAGQP